MKLSWGLHKPDRPIVNDLVTRIRLKISDTSYNKFSDSEILFAMNDGIELLFQALANNFSTVVQKVKEYTLTTGAALLPDDFYTLESLDECDELQPTKLYRPCRRYRGRGIAHIEGQYIFGRGHIRMVYNYKPHEVTRVDDSLDIPYALVTDLVNITANLATMNIDAARLRASEAGARMSQRREYSTVPPRIAFP